MRAKAALRGRRRRTPVADLGADPREVLLEAAVADGTDPAVVAWLARLLGVGVPKTVLKDLPECGRK